MAKMTSEEKAERAKERVKLRKESLEIMLSIKKECLPCPFCGDLPLIGYVGVQPNVEYTIGCGCMVSDGNRFYNSSDDVSRMSFRTRECRDPNIAIKRWNRDFRKKKTTPITETVKQA